MSVYGGIKSLADIERKQRIEARLLKRIFKTKDDDRRRLYQAVHNRLCNRIIRASRRIHLDLNQEIGCAWGSQD